jgi:hypothetical protein
MAGRSTDTAPAFRATAVTKSDTTVLPTTRGLYVGGAGAVAVIMAGDTAAVTFSAVPAGSFMPIQVTKVMETNTDATLILALY